MRRIVLVFIFCFLSVLSARGQNVAIERAAKMKLGMNLSYLDHYWLGTKEKKFADFLDVGEAMKRKKMFAEIKAAGFSTVRIPICFSAWMDFEPPFAWNNKKGLEMADRFVQWALENDLIAIIDLHHTEFDNSIPAAKNTERTISLWDKIARRYKNTDPSKVFFELRNEPRDISAKAWRLEAGRLIKVVRKSAPKHTLVVGFHDWNGLRAMVDSKPFNDSNIIYTFHYYEPFVFTHQGATWSGDGLAELKGVPFPYNRSTEIKVPKTAEGNWVGNRIKNYRENSSEKKMFAELKEAKNWSVKHGVPIFLGEFGSFSKFADKESRCRHAKFIYTATGKLEIPNAWWEWDGGFNMYKKGTNQISPCMREAIDSYKISNQKQRGAASQ